MRVPDAPDGISLEEWRRAVALLAATATHAENTTISPVMREMNVVTSAKKFEAYLKDGR
jgi:hypothetical protein